jgi:uncharacterized RDD family membrane protein YckC
MATSTAAVEDAAAPATASWGRRFAAWLIDCVIVFVVPLFLVFLIGDFLWDDETVEGVGFLVGLAAIILMPLYFAIFHAAMNGQTPAKRGVGIAVRDERTGGRLGFGPALARAYLMFALYLAGSIGLILDGLWPLWDKKKQALHDKATHSIVVRVPPRTRNP